MTKASSGLVWASLLLASLTACDPSSRLERKAPQDISLVESYFDLIRGGHSDQVEALLDPALQNPESRSSFRELVATIPQEVPRSVKAVLVNPRCEDGKCEDHIILEYRYSTERLLFNTVLLKEAGQVSIIGIHISLIPDSLIKANEFTLAHKGFSQYLILALAILFPAFSLLVLVLCLRARIGPWKWVWAAFILCGVTRLAINWTTGELDFQFLSIQLLSADAFAQPYGPWVISVSLPLGAILFLIIYRNRLFHTHPDGLNDKKMAG
jgi:hypothetical protein